MAVFLLGARCMVDAEKFDEEGRCLLISQISWGKQMFTSHK